MSNKKYDILVFIGRFQPFHNGHKSVIDRALELSEKVIVFVGSANRSRTGYNSFYFHERASVIHAAYAGPEADRIIIEPLDDVLYGDDLWIESVQEKVYDTILRTINPDNPHINLHGTKDVRIGLIGCEKDSTGFYLNMFPTWGNERVDFVDPINATDIRNAYFKDGIVDGHPVPDSVAKFLAEFKGSEEHSFLLQEMAYNEQYPENAKKYPRIEQAVDAVVVQSAHVLLIRRRSYPGKGKWALPGGFVNPDETFQNAMLRELKEETKIDVPEKVLRKSIETERLFDDPRRSDRGRIVTHAYLIKLENRSTLPKVKGSDDADKARWVPLAELDPLELFEDHYWIIQNLIRSVKDDA